MMKLFFKQAGHFPAFTQVLQSDWLLNWVRT